MLDALLATIGTLGILASIVAKWRAPRAGEDASGAADEQPAETAAPRASAHACPRRRVRRRRRAA